jgi:hypothetical protein
MCHVGFVVIATLCVVVIVVEAEIGWANTRMCSIDYRAATDSSHGLKPSLLHLITQQCHYIKKKRG